MDANHSRGIADLFIKKLQGDNLPEAVDTYLTRVDTLFRIALDVAERGSETAEEKGDHDNANRFNDIIGLIRAYQAGIDMFIGRVFEDYPLSKKPKAA
jgi:hypothetical protein